MRKLLWKMHARLTALVITKKGKSRLISMIGMLRVVKRREKAGSWFLCCNFEIFLKFIEKKLFCFVL